MSQKGDNYLITKVCLPRKINTSKDRNREILPRKAMTQTMMTDKIMSVRLVKTKNKRQMSAVEFPPYLCLLIIKRILSMHMPIRTRKMMNFRTKTTGTIIIEMGKEIIKTGGLKIKTMRDLRIGTTMVGTEMKGFNTEEMDVMREKGVKGGMGVKNAMDVKDVMNVRDMMNVMNVMDAKDVTGAKDATDDRNGKNTMNSLFKKNLNRRYNHLKILHSNPNEYIPTINHQ